MEVLSQTAVKQFVEQGYYVNNGALFSDEKFSRLYDIFIEHLSSKGSKKSDELDTPHFQDERLFDFLMDEHVLDIVEDCIGPNIGLWSSHFISKDPKTGRPTPWHSDAGYWQGRFDTFTGIVTIWLALERSDRGNGCMKVIPGTHRKEDGEYVPVDDRNTFRFALQNIDESEAVYFELDPNEFSLHDSRLIHGAEANTSDRRRTGYTMRYFSQEMKLNPDHPHNPQHRIWHCRGKNLRDNPVEN
jgi:ectoine hydroxylase-related dioxygenase (phytanoyl-CoA dioxygenase family)